MTLDNHKIVGSRGVLIKLDAYTSPIEIDEDGIYTPLYENYETDGGRPASKFRIEEYSPIGTILQISEKAQELLQEEKMDLKVGDRVTIFKSQRIGFNEFIEDRTKPIEVFKGYLTVHPSAIQSKLI